MSQRRTEGEPDPEDPARPGGRELVRTGEPEDPPLHGEDDDLAILEDEEEGQAHPAATALWALLGILAVSVTAIWAAPKIAPYVPAPIARFLAPVPEQVTERVEGLEARLAAAEAARAEAARRLEAALAEAEAGASPEAEARLTRIADRLAALENGQTAAAATGEAARAEARAALAEAEAARRAAETAAEGAADAGRAAEALGETAAEARRVAETAAAAADRATGAAEESARAANVAHSEARAAEGAAAELARGLAEQEERLAGLEAELRALGQGLVQGVGAEAGGPAPAEAMAAIAALRARIDALEAARQSAPEFLPRAEAEGLASQAALAALRARQDSRIGALAEEVSRLGQRLSERIAGLSREIETGLAKARKENAQDLDALERRLAAAEARASTTHRSALGEAEAALRRAALRSAADALATRVLAGEPYAAVLAEVEALVGHAAPEALSAHAASGLVPPARLAERLPAAARAAIKAEARAGGDGSPTGRVASWLQSQVFVMPTEEQAGDDLAARVSRIEARLSEGELEAALAEAEGLPRAARRAMSDWTGALRRRVEAEAALARFVAPAVVGD